MKVLAIGNSFSQDATAYLYGMAHAAGQDAKVVNLYIGGCPLSRHAFNALGGGRDYALEYNGFLTGFRVSVRDALQNDAWDAVTVQQASHASFDYGSYQPYLETLAAYIRTYAPGAELLVHQTWAYEEGAERLREMGFAHARDMFAQVEAAYARAAELLGARLIPAGRAVQRAAEAGLARMHRDGYHLSLGAGRYLAACVWLESVFGVSCRGSAFAETAEALPPELRAALETVAHETVRENA